MLALAMGFKALYLHIPFCRVRCAYCDFDTRAYGACELDAAIDAYLAQLVARLDAFGEAGALSDVETVYIGGGTPSVLGERLPELVQRARCWCTPVEFTCEANPESFTDELAAALAEAGVTRISLGVQSLDDVELRAIGRIHTAGEALAAIDRAKRYGFSTSCDLMCGLPGQTPESWGRTLDAAIAANPDHVSVYPLQVEEGTPLDRRIEAGELAVPDEDFQADAMDLARTRLTAAGLEPYEVASYARPGHTCRHNIAYWTGKPYLGLGRSAASMFDISQGLSPLAQSRTVPNGTMGTVPKWTFGGAELPGEGRVRVKQLDDAGVRFETEALTAREAMAEDLMLACRMTVGIPADLLRRAAEVIPAAELRLACERAISLGLATWTGSALTPTTLGWLDGNELFELFWDLADE